MHELRRDPITGRWVVVLRENGMGPGDFEVEKHEIKGGANCPFCPGREGMTPPEIDAHREGGTERDKPGWSTRIIPNKFPALGIEGELNKHGIGLYDMMNGVGAHEVIIETPDHTKQFADFSDHEIEKVVWAYKNRSVDLRGDKRFRYLLIFKNYGRSAGASLEHSHSQLIALPIVPKRVKEELIGSLKYFDYRGRCVFCDMITQEKQESLRIVAENDLFISFCPAVSRFAFESWILPKEHSADFSYIQADSVVALSNILGDTMRKIKKGLKDPSYNLIIHTAPIEERQRDDYHWHIEIMPKLANVAGFEWGSGFYINPISPEDAAKYLRGIKV